MAGSARQHNNANVLCLGGDNTAPELAKKILDAFLAAQFEGGRHERRVNKMELTPRARAICGCATWIPTSPTPFTWNGSASRKTSS